MDNNYHPLFNQGFFSLALGFWGVQRTVNTRQDSRFSFSIERKKSISGSCI
jgi:hypothetical protein